MNNFEKGISRREMLIWGGLLVIGSAAVAWGALQSLAELSDSENAKPEMKDFQSDVLPFKMKLLPDWTADKNTHLDERVGIVTISTNNSTKEGNSTIVVSMHKGDRTPVDGYTRNFIEKLTTLFDTTASEWRVKETAAGKVSNQEAEIITLSRFVKVYDQNQPFKYNLEEDLILKNYVFRYGDDLWTVTYTDILAEFKKRSSEVDRMVATFQLT